MNKFLDKKLIHLCLEIEYYMKVAKGRRFQNVSVKDFLSFETSNFYPISS